jgi:hypothetical protein
MNFVTHKLMLFKKNNSMKHTSEDGNQIVRPSAPDERCADQRSGGVRAVNRSWSQSRARDITLLHYWRKINKE